MIYLRIFIIFVFLKINYLNIMYKLLSILILSLLSVLPLFSQADTNVSWCANINFGQISNEDGEKVVKWSYYANAPISYEHGCEISAVLDGPDKNLFSYSTNPQLPFNFDIRIDPDFLIKVYFDITFNPAEATLGEKIAFFNLIFNYEDELVLIEQFKLIADVVLGIEENSIATHLNISPNPVSTNAIINFGLLGNADITFEVCNLEGHTIYNMSNFYEEGEHTLSLATEDFASGNYILRMLAKGKQIGTEKIKILK